MTLFLSTDKVWYASERTSVGFRHHKIGNVVLLPTRELAVERAKRLGLEVE